MTMLQKIREYAKGIAGAVGLAATAVAPTLPIDSAAQLYVGIAAAVAGLVAVVCVPNARPADELAAAKTVVLSMSAAPALKNHADAVLKLASVLGRYEGLVALKPAVSDNGGHVVDPAPASGAGAVVDAPSVPVAAVPADPAPVVADGEPAVAIPDPPVPPVDPPADVLPPAEAEAPAAPADPALAAGLDDGVTLPDDVPPPTVGILTS